MPTADNSTGLIVLSFAVIIPTLNESASIRRAIGSAQAVGAEEVIVADGGSTDSTVSLAAAAGANVVTSPAGRGIQMNAAADQATQDYLMFLHADSWLPADCSNQIREAISKEIPYFCFKQRIENPRWIFRWIEKGNTMRARFQKLPYGDQGITVSRKLFEELGGFPSIPLMEDVVFARKVSRHASPLILPGPINVSDRRWKTNGAFRQTFRNWMTMLRFRLGWSPDKLARAYNRDNQNRSVESSNKNESTSPETRS